MPPSACHQKKPQFVDGRRLVDGHRYLCNVAMAMAMAMAIREAFRLYLEIKPAI
jgi:hypothetical protein